MTHSTVKNITAGRILDFAAIDTATLQADTTMQCTLLVNGIQDGT